MHDFGHGGSVNLIKALPEGAQALTFEVTNDDLNKIGFANRQLHPGKCAESPEVLRVHELRKRPIERGDSTVSVVSFRSKK